MQTAAFLSTPALRAPAKVLSARRGASLSMQLSPPNRRQLLLGVAGMAIGVLGQVQPTSADTMDIQVYFGSGCFWHVQHEMIVAEGKILGRSEKDSTAIAGYAGGTKVGTDGKVCYHNMNDDSDYGDMGHSEAVGVKIPESNFPEFVTEFFDLFIDGERADPQDRGGEYRSVLGIPGGVKGAMFPIAKDAASKKGMTLVEGKGDDPDTLRTKTVFVYDTALFPFYPGEVYHQYHDDMVYKYGAKYKANRKEAVKDGKIKPTGCPEIGF
eukprot:CAMPEP_0181312608 /NCGR_PEP_ID=MMETSP1101-20121128/13791_1 /TAXON_ID=46948 /ORGANISM="Rhodomonas abbreviata, Strain Caron Lab Isolate" /LENGTH=267 /DNA_ID=CAMNT_0023419477 /DNA_START=72 /DNA_END=875 /DNA_ORIENTATION=-